MKTTLTTKLFAGITLLMALFALVVIFSYRLAGQVLRNAQQVEASQHVSNEAVTLLRNIVDMETGFRGYLLIGNEQTLAPYYYGEREMVGRFSSLRDLVQDAPSQTKRLDSCSITGDENTLLSQPRAIGFDEHKTLGGGVKRNDPI